MVVNCWNDRTLDQLPFYEISHFLSVSGTRMYLWNKLETLFNKGNEKKELDLTSTVVAAISFKTTREDVNRLYRCSFKQIEIQVFHLFQNHQNAS